MRTTESCEKRKYRRIPIALDLSFRKVGSKTEKIHTGRTVNVSTGGLYFETAAPKFEQGNLLRIELSIPPTAGLLELGGAVSAFARVLRTSKISDTPKGIDLYGTKYGIALQFYHRPRLCR